MRKQSKVKRESLHRALSDERIADVLLRSELMKEESFFVYLSVYSEVSTQKIISELLKRKKRVCVPRITEGEMIAVPLGKTVIGRYGIEGAEGEDTPCAVALTPLLAFDESGFRLGYGGGYYDRYFRKHPAILKIGLAYSGQAFEMIPHEQFDVPLDGVVCEDGIRTFRNRS